MNRTWSKILIRMIVFALLSALLLAIAFTILDFSENFVQNVLSGAIVGAITGVVICAAIGVLERELIPQEDIRHSATGTVSNVIIGGCVGLIAASVLVTITFTIVGQINHLPDPFLWGALISTLAGWPLGILIGVIIGAGWRRVRL